MSALALVGIVSWSSAFLLVADKTGPEVYVTLIKNSPASLRQQPKVSTASWDPRGGKAVATKPLKTLAKAQESLKPQVLGASTFGTAGLTTEQALELDKPGVVGIINWMDGKLSIPDFDIDLKTFKLTPRPDLSVHTMKADWNVYGSGFVVNTDGYIATNAHVVAKDSAYDEMRQDVVDHWKDVLDYEIQDLPKKEQDALNKYIDETYGEATGNDKTDKAVIAMNKGIDDFIKDNLVDESTQNVVVIDKSMKGEKLEVGKEVEQIYKRGLPATIVSFDKNYRDTQKDVAIIKLTENNLPALPLGSSDNLSSGAKVVMMGFPYNAQINDSDWFEPTFTEGVVGAIKENKGQKLIQLDNKLSHGSSGGPLVDLHGNVVGMTTYLTGEDGEGDDFGLALPVEVVKEAMSNKNISNDLGVFGSNLLLGFYNQNNSFCKKALENFNQAATADQHFLVKDSLSAHIQSCQDLIAAHLSKDSILDIARIYYQQNLSTALIYTMLGLVLVFFVIYLIILGVRHLKSQPKVNLPGPSVPVPRPL